MKLRSGIQLAMAASLLFFSIMASADAQFFVHCPSVDLVKDAGNKLSLITPDSQNPGTYTVSTSVPVFTHEDKSWYVGTQPIVADNDNDALLKGKDNVINSTSQKNKYAYPVGSYYVCLYVGKNPSLTVAALAPKGSLNKPAAGDFKE